MTKLPLAWRRRWAHALVLVLSLLVSSVAGQAEVPGTWRYFDLDGGGWVTGIDQHPSGRIYARTDANGAYRSDDRGETWTWLGGHPSVAGQGQLQGIAVAPGNADVVYTANGWRTSPGPYRGVWKSSDAGATWTHVLPEVNFSGNGDDGGQATAVRWAGESLVFDPMDPTDATVWAGAIGGLWRTQNAGTSWSKVGGTLFDPHRLSVVYLERNAPVERRNHVWVGAYSGLWVSLNNGETWTSFADWKIVYRIVRLADAGGTLFIAGERLNGARSLTRVTAANWNDPATFVFTEQVGAFGSGDGALALLAVVDDGTALVAGTHNGAMRRSNDGGTTWQALPMQRAASPAPIFARPGAGLPYGRNDLAQDPDQPNRWYLCTGFYFAISDDAGATWRPSSLGIGEVLAQKAQFHPSRPDLVLVPSADINFVLIDMDTGGKIGRAEYATKSRTPAWPDEIAHGNALVMLDAQHWIVAGTHYFNGAQFVETFDGGATWATRNTFSLNTAGVVKPQGIFGIENRFRPFTNAVQAPDNPKEFLLVVGVRIEDAGAGIYRTTDGGVNFTKHGSFPWTNLSFFGSEFTNRNALYADSRPARLDHRYLWVQNRGFARSTDRGVNWTAAQLPDGAARTFGSIVMNSARPGELWAMLDTAAGAPTGRSLWRLNDAADPAAAWELVGDFTFNGDLPSFDVAGDRVIVHARRPGDSVERWYLSQDAGATWAELEDSYLRFGGAKVALDPHRAGHIWFSIPGRSVELFVQSGLGGDSTAPSAPAGLDVIDATSTSFTLTWQPSVDEQGVVGYEILRNGTLVAHSSGTSAAFTGLTAGRTYSFTVRAYDAGGNRSTPSAPRAVLLVDQQAPTAPQALVATQLRDAGFRLTWQGATDDVGVAGYDVARDGALIGTAASPGFSVTQLISGVTYVFTVRARDAAGNLSPWSAPLAVMGGNLIGNPGFESGSAAPWGTWNAASRVVSGQARTGDYSLLVGPASGGGDQTNLTVEPGATYHFGFWHRGVSGQVTVVQRDASGATVTTTFVGFPAAAAYTEATRSIVMQATTTRVNITWFKSSTTGEAHLDDFVLRRTSPPDTTPPAAPGGLASSAVLADRFTLSWSPATDDVVVIGYEIARDGVTIGSTASTTWEVTGLAAGTTYPMTVRARDGAGNWSPWSAPLVVKTRPLIDENGGTLVFRQGTSGYGGTVDSYLSENSPTTAFGAATTVVVDTDNPSGSGRREQGLLRFDGLFGSSPGQIPPGATIIAAVLRLETSNLGDGARVHRMATNWNNATTWSSLGGNGVQPDGVEAREASEFTTGAVALGGRDFDVTASVQAWAQGETNHGWVFLPSGTDGWAFSSAEGPNPPRLTVTYTVETPPDTTPPSTPGAPTLTGRSASTLTFTWGAATDNVAVVDYLVWYNDELATTVTDPQATIAGLAPATGYRLEVAARDAAGNVSSRSAALEATTLPPPDTQAPTPPGDLTATAVSSTTVALTWTAATDNVGVTAYDIYVDGVWQRSVHDVSVVVRDLRPRTTYRFEVRARDAASNASALSTALLVTTAREPGQGLTGEYFNHDDLTGFVAERIDGPISFDWGVGAPLAGMDADTFAVVWSGQVEAPTTDTYTFTIHGDDGVRLWLNGVLLIDQWANRGLKQYSGSMWLEAGERYDLVLEYREVDKQARVSLWWAAPGAERTLVPADYLFPHLGGERGTGLTGTYFAEPDFTQPVVQRVDAGLDWQWPQPPDPALGAGGYAVRWTGRVEVTETADHLFEVDAVGPVRLWVNGQLLIDRFTLGGEGPWRGTIQLTGGASYPVRLDYRAPATDARLRLAWAETGGATAPVPAVRLYPEAGDQGAGLGLTGVYFDTRELSGERLRRRDAQVRFNWGSGAVAPGLPTQKFSARWTGQLEAPVAGAYTVSTFTDDGVRLWLDGELVIDRWQNQTPTMWAVERSFTAGQRVDVVMEYGEQGGEALAELRWSGPGMGPEPVPTSRLFPRVDGDAQPPSAPANVQAGELVGNAVALTWGPSTDNDAVAGYEVLRDGVRVSSLTGTSELVTGLEPGRTYVLAVQARDVAGNRSARAEVTVVTPAPNLVLNPSFESATLAPWGAWNAESGRTTEEARTGGASLRLGPGSGGGDQVNIAVEAGGAYTFAFWHKGGAARLKVVQLTATGGVIANTFAEFPAAGAWTANARTITMAANCAKVKIEWWKSSTTGYAYIDDVSLTRN